MNLIVLFIIVRKYPAHNKNQEIDMMLELGLGRIKPKNKVKLREVSNTNNREVRHFINVENKTD